MADGVTLPDEGPALWYVHAGGGAVTRVDLKPPETQSRVPDERFPTMRERRILRALLEQAASLLDLIDSPDQG